LLQSPLVRKRALGADILGQLGYGKTFHNECALALLKRLKFEYSPWVLTSIGVAAGHLNDPRFARPLSDLAKHLDRDVRFGATFGLLCIDSPIAIKSLIKLSSDKVNKVRDWATFGLGSQHEKDNPAIRKALKARLNDKHYETRLEAIAGLAQRKDPTAKAIVLKWLMTRKRVPNIIWESAEDLGLDPKGIRTKAGL
jgi:HEAT repeat protein